METTNVNELQNVFNVMSRWQTAAEQPLHPTSFQQLIQDEIAAIRVSEFLPHEVTRHLQQSQLVQKILTENKPFGPLLAAHSPAQMANYKKAAQESVHEWLNTQPKGFDLATELSDILNSAARRPVVQAMFQNEPLFVGHIRKIHGDEKISPYTEKPSHPIEVFSHVDAQLRWMIPLTVSGEHVHLNILNGSENPGRLTLQAGDLILTNRRNGTEHSHPDAHVIVMEGFVVRLASGEFIFWS